MRAREWTVTGLTMLEESEAPRASGQYYDPRHRTIWRDRHVTVSDELLDSLARVGGGDLGGLSGVEPDWTAEGNGRQVGAFLRLQSSRT